MNTIRDRSPTARRRRGRRLILLVGLVPACISIAGFTLGQFEDFDVSSPMAGISLESTAPPGFERDVFTIARVRYYTSSGWRDDDSWETDWPDSDLNFLYRLQQLTAFEVDPQGAVVELDDDEVFDYPFLYMVEPTRLYLGPDEVKNLRRYLLNGGFLLVDDLWGDEQWGVVYREFKKVFPDREPVELPIDHEIFSCVYELKEKPQVPSIRAALAGKAQGITWQGGDDAKIPHFRAFFDDNDRMVLLICHNTDIGDGWEREGEDEWYFREFSEKKSYPMGINIVTYALTH